VSDAADPLPVQRDAFEVPAAVAYLNCAYVAPNLRSVREAGEQAVARKSRPWEITPPDFFDESEEARRCFARICGGDADGVAIVPSVSYGIGVAAANTPVGRGGRVLVLEDQFPSNVYPWREAVAGHGGRVEAVPRPADHDWTAALLGRLGADVDVVAVPNVHWTDGSFVDLERVGTAARDVGAALVVDATQSLGALPFDVDVVQPDFVVAAAYKWLLGPYSVGYLWAAPDRRDGTPLEFNWITRAGAEDFASLVDYRDDYEPGARRYDVGERSNFALLPMSITAMRQVLDWGVERIAATAAAFTDRIERETLAMDLLPVPASRRGRHMLGVELPRGAPTDLVSRLAAADVHVSVRGRSVRISPHVWNTEEDVSRLLDVLEDAL
jgi:selenocysteine lyase/cysteine desulfurase